MVNRCQPRRWGFLLGLSLLLAITLGVPSAAAIQTGSTARYASQNVDWLSAEQASLLALDFPVLVPGFIPGPFTGTPSISASGGYYSLYWMVSSGTPTFLQITGEVGGGLPAGSPADLNVELSVNANVQGSQAIHDVTSIYDTVWWISGGVLYTVSSRNMTGSDSLSLANSLYALQAPAAPEPEPEPAVDVDQPVPEVATNQPVDEDVSPSGALEVPTSVDAGETVSIGIDASAPSTLQASDGSFPATGSTAIGNLSRGTANWEAPNSSVATNVSLDLVDEATGTITSSVSVAVVPASIGGTSGGVSNTSTGVVPGRGQSEPELEEGLVDQPAARQSQSATMGDGTAGPDLPASGDGTGGVRQIAIP